MSSNETTTEYRVRWSRTDNRTGYGMDERFCGSLEDALAVARHQFNIDRVGVLMDDGTTRPVGNPLTINPYVERREVTSWERIADTVAAEDARVG